MKKHRVWLCWLVGLAGLAQGQPESWESLGPYGMPIYALAVHPQAPERIFAATPNGLLRSTDGGSHWSRSWSADWSLLYDIDISPSDPATVLITGARGVFRSTDAGESWSESGFNHEIIYFPKCLAIDPLRTERMYLMVNYAKFGGGSGTYFYRSTTAEVGWWTVKFVPWESQIATLAIDPVENDTVYACLGRLIYRSTDAGDTWTNWSTAPADRVQAMAVNPGLPGTLFIATEAGLFTTRDGTGWRQLGLCLTEFRALVFDSRDPAVGYAGSLGGGVYRSTDWGESWEPLNEGLADLQVQALATEGGNPAVLYAGTASAGVFGRRETAVWHPYEVFIPLAAHSRSINGISWFTDLYVANRGREPAAVQVQLLRQGQANPAPETQARLLDPGETACWPDVLGRALPGENGALRILSDQLETSATAFFYNDRYPGPAGGEQGVAVPAAGRGEMLAGGTGRARGELFPLKSAPGIVEGYRTNIGCVNTGGTPADIVVRLFGDDGQAVGRIERTLGPFEQIQFTHVFSWFGAGEVSRGRAELEVLTAGAAVAGYALVIHNANHSLVYLRPQTHP